MHLKLDVVAAQKVSSALLETQHTTTTSYPGWCQCVRAAEQNSCCASWNFSETNLFCSVLHFDLRDVRWWISISHAFTLESHFTSERSYWRSDMSLSQQPMKISWWASWSVCRTVCESVYSFTELWARLQTPFFSYKALWWLLMATVGRLVRPTVHGDVDGTAALSSSRLTPVHPSVWWVNVIDEALGVISFPPVNGTLFVNVCGCVSLNFPLRGVFMLPTAQRDRFISKELAPTGADSQRGCKKQKDDFQCKCVHTASNRGCREEQPVKPMCHQSPLLRLVASLFHYGCYLSNKISRF